MRRAILGIALAVSLFLGGRELLNADFFKIKSIEVIGADKISPEDIKSLVSSEIVADQSWFFPRNNFLFINTGRINNLLQKTFPDFSRVRTTLAGIGNLVIEVSERAPYAIWCDSNGGHCSIIDSQGFAFDKNSDSRSATLTIFTDSKPTIGGIIFDENKFSEIKKILNHFNQSGFKIISISENKNDYFIKIETDLEVRITSGDELESITTKLISIINDQNSAQDHSSIDYIDLRYGNKVFIKRR